MNAEIPILRLGKTYQSLDTISLAQEEGELQVHQANPGLIRRDLRRLDEAHAALAKFSTDELAGFCEKAADLFMEAELPMGTGVQGPDDYIRSLSHLTGLPHSLCRRNMGKVHEAMANIRKILAGLTRGIDLKMFDQGFAKQGELEVNYFAVTKALGVVLPSNSPGVNSLWLPAPVLKIPVILKPGREDPLTPFRIVMAMIQAGFPPEAFGFYPTTHEGGDTILFECGRGIVFGSDATVKKYAKFSGIQVHGSGRSKILIGEDEADDWEKHLEVMVESIASNGGRSCINASGVLIPRHGRELAEALAAKLAKIEPLPRDHPEAMVCGFAKPDFAKAISAAIDEELKTPGAEDLTAAHYPEGRVVEKWGQTFLRPTLVWCEDPGHALANTEYMFPFASVVEIPQEKMLDQIGETLVGSAFTRDPQWSRELMNSHLIERLNLGAYPTNRVQWEQPHEGNLFEFLYRRRAIQGDLAMLA